MKPPFPIFLSNTLPLDPYILALLLPHLIRRYIYLNSPVKTLQAPRFPVPPNKPKFATSEGGSQNWLRHRFAAPCPQTFLAANHPSDSPHSVASLCFENQGG